MEVQNKSLNTTTGVILMGSSSMLYSQDDRTLWFFYFPKITENCFKVSEQFASMQYNSYALNSSSINVTSRGNAVEFKKQDHVTTTYLNDMSQGTESNCKCTDCITSSFNVSFEPKSTMLNLPFRAAYDEKFTIPSLFISSDIHKELKPVIPTKRAAQNRAAQRAFRLRKERYVKNLEQRVKLLDQWKIEIERLRMENHQLRIELGKTTQTFKTEERQTSYDSEPQKIPDAVFAKDPAYCAEMTKNSLYLIQYEETSTTAATAFALPIFRRTKKKKNVKEEPVRLLPRQIETSFQPVRLHSPEHINFQNTTNSFSPPL
ncbi:hypothetical protein BDF20DRAFT_920080 [Mycotypha africana]|uniref:uncharacterized protein n=1 Tax=Mycotypha africana TaxID=64632 RepID=UPI002300749C|nr:uncharacterized protein BDF20DRAFT_920080 [Mycotypha africana]KAI8991420.1 hypothetical protein BDF20DRAFT_920080 [Mycotypha africana]